MTIRGLISSFRWLSAGLLAAAAPAFAVDVVGSAPPTPVADNALTIGSRTLRLPDGSWNFIARGEGSIRRGSVDKAAPHFTAYAMDVANGRMQASVQLRLPLNSAVVTSWNEQPCNVEGTIFKDDFGPDYKFPACLAVFKRRSHLSPASASDAFFGQAHQWATAQSVKLPGPVYEFVYTRFGSNDFGMARIYLPLQAFGSDDEAIAWSKSLPGHLQRLFESRDNQAQLPPLPKAKS